MLVIGAGGLGAPVIAYLAAAGVGTISVVDDDTVSLSNLQRQIIHDTAHVGHEQGGERAPRRAAHQSACAGGRLSASGSTSENGFALVAMHDIVVDGSDNFDTRYLLADAVRGGRSSRW